MASDRLTGSFLQTLAASKPGGKILEIGTGTGLATAWLLRGMDEHSQLLTIDQDVAVVAVAKRYLGADPRATFLVDDAGLWLEQARDHRFDLIFADAWPGKYSHLDDAIELLAPGGLYVVDDMLPQPNWPEGHARHVEGLVKTLDDRADLSSTLLEWSTGLIVAVKQSAPRAIG